MASITIRRAPVRNRASVALDCDFAIACKDIQGPGVLKVTLPGELAIQSTAPAAQRLDDQSVEWLTKSTEQVFHLRAGPKADLSPGRQLTLRAVLTDATGRTRAMSIWHWQVD